MKDRSERKEIADDTRSVLIDVLTILGKFRDNLVVVGGWVPELYFPNSGHIGSLDVDLAPIQTLYRTMSTRQSHAS